MKQALETYGLEHQAELMDLVCTLSQIPAPSGKEDARAHFCKHWLEQAGFPSVTIDKAKNVICPVGTDTAGDIIIFMAHMDTVFPDETPMPMTQDGSKLYCPGIGDDTANLAIMLMAAKGMRQLGGKPCCGVVFCANSCEEGLGNLKGCRTLLDTYQGRVRQVISFDLGLDTVFTQAVGSARYRIRLHTQGGHSYLDYGKPNAIAQMAELIQALYQIPMPADATCNVGTISGGTSVNTIAQKCEILYEYRACSNESLERMAQSLRVALAPYGDAAHCELLGLRPGMGVCQDPASQEALTRRIEQIVTAVTGAAPRRSAGSTDCNIPFSLGIPAACVGLVRMAGAHTRQEYIELPSLPQGLSVALQLMAPYFF